jgi:hypothetical protein
MADDNSIDQPVIMQGAEGDLGQQSGLDQYAAQFLQQNTAIPQELYQILFRSQSTTKNTSQPNEFTARGSWTQQEDEQLISAVQQFGPKKWIDIAKFVPTRTSKQCRERWHHRLDPALKHEPFEPWEDQLIIEKQREIGNRWAVIAHQLPGRSASAIKNRWYSGLKSQHPTHAQMDISMSMVAHLHQQVPSLDPTEQEASGVMNPASTDL